MWTKKKPPSVGGIGKRDGRFCGIEGLLAEDASSRLAGQRALQFLDQEPRSLGVLFLGGRCQLHSTFLRGGAVASFGEELADLDRLAIEFLDRRVPRQRLFLANGSGPHLALELHDDVARGFSDQLRTGDASEVHSDGQLPGAALGPVLVLGLRHFARVGELVFGSHFHLQ